MSIDAKMTAIADKIRSLSGTTEKLSLDQMPQAIHDAYDMGCITTEAWARDEFYNQGYEEGYQEGHEVGILEGETSGIQIGYEQGYKEGYEEGSKVPEDVYQTAYDEGWFDGWNDGWYSGDANGWIEGQVQGRQDEWSEFWDTFQNKGSRSNYAYAFQRWGASIFKPKYPFILKGTGTNHGSMFYVGPKGDLTQILSDCGIYLDTSGVTEFSTLFYAAGFSRIPVIDTRGATKIEHTFMSENIKTIDGIILKDDGSQTISAGTFNTSGLVNVTFEGVIGNNVTFVNCKSLSKASIINIINTLSDTTDSKTLTLSKVAVDKVFETSTNANDGSTSTEWTTLIAMKSNWTISLN